MFSPSLYVFLDHHRGVLSDTAIGGLSCQVPSTASGGACGEREDDKKQGLDGCERTASRTPH